MRQPSIPFATGLALLAWALPATADDQPKNLRVSLQFIEVPHPVLTDLLAVKDNTGPALHDQVMAVVKDGRAKVLESCVVMTRSGQKATTESITEVLYPTGFDPSDPGFGFGWLPRPQPPPPPTKPRQRVRPFPGSGFETHNAGLTFEIEPTLQDDGRVIQLWFEPELDALVRVDTMLEHIDEWGDTSVRMPIFETWQLKTCVELTDGQFEMVSVITPKPNTPSTPPETKGGTGSHGLRSFREAGLPVQAIADQNQHGRAARAPLVADPATPRKILVFIRADVVTVGN